MHSHLSYSPVNTNTHTLLDNTPECYTEQQKAQFTGRNVTIDQLTGNIGRLSKCPPESWAPHFGLTATSSGLEFMSWLLDRVPAPIVNALRYIGGLGEHKFQVLEFDKVSSTPSIGRLVFDTLEDSETR